MSQEQQLENCIQIAIKEFVKDNFDLNELNDPSWNIGELSSEIATNIKNNLEYLDMDFLYKAHLNYEINERLSYIKDFCLDEGLNLSDAQIYAISSEMVDDFTNKSVFVDMATDNERYWLEDSKEHGTIKELLDKKEANEPTENKNLKFDTLINKYKQIDSNGLRENLNEGSFLYCIWQDISLGKQEKLFDIFDKQEILDIVNYMQANGFSNAKSEYLKMVNKAKAPNHDFGHGRERVNQDKQEKPTLDKKELLNDIKHEGR